MYRLMRYYNIITNQRWRIATILKIVFNHKSAADWPSSSSSSSFRLLKSWQNATYTIEAVKFCVGKQSFLRISAMGNPMRHPRSTEHSCICTEFCNYTASQKNEPTLSKLQLPKVGSLLSRRTWQRERVSASVLSICLSVCLSPKCKKTLFSQKLSNLELWSILTTHGKSYIGFSKNPLLDP